MKVQQKDTRSFHLDIPYLLVFRLFLILSQGSLHSDNHKNVIVDQQDTVIRLVNFWNI